jgi:hypothetical protein
MPSFDASDTRDATLAMDAAIDAATDAGDDRPAVDADASANCPGADLRMDPFNCGRCGVRCCGGWCYNGVCGAEGPPGVIACGTDRTDCTGPVAVNPQSDPRNCGACGHACAAGQSCAAGVCVCGCSPGLSCCGGACVDLRSDPLNCGGCGLACRCLPSPICAAGVCDCVCPVGMSLCGGACVDLRSDRNNCGACGAACPAAQTCQNSVCVPAPDAMDVSADVPIDAP